MGRQGRGFSETAGECRLQQAGRRLTPVVARVNMQNCSLSSRGGIWGLTCVQLDTVVSTSVGTSALRRARPPRLSCAGCSLTISPIGAVGVCIFLPLPFACT
jgi:hypothetical protein